MTSFQPKDGSCARAISDASPSKSSKDDVLNLSLIWAVAPALVKLAMTKGTVNLGDQF